MQKAPPPPPFRFRILKFGQNKVRPFLSLAPSPFLLKNKMQNTCWLIIVILIPIKPCKSLIFFCIVLFARVNLVRYVYCDSRFDFRSFRIESESTVFEFLRFKFIFPKNTFLNETMLLRIFHQFLDELV